MLLVAVTSLIFRPGGIYPNPGCSLALFLPDDILSLAARSNRPETHSCLAHPPESESESCSSNTYLPRSGILF